MRWTPKQAILMLTAKGAESDVLEGFKSGADDYVSKPFSVPQLVARVQALVRRAAPEAARQFHLGGLEIDADRLVASRGSASEALSPRDVEVLAYFSSAAPGKVVTARSPPGRRGALAEARPAGRHAHREAPQEARAPRGGHS